MKFPSALYSIVLALFLISMASAIEIQASTNTNMLVKGVDNAIELDLEITNATPGFYNIYTLSDMTMTPTGTFQIVDGSLQQTFLLTPNEHLDVDGYYTFTYTIHERDVQKYDEKLTVDLVNLEDVIEISSDNIEVADTNEVTFYVRNLENVHLKNLKATFSSLVFDTQQIFDLAPFERRSFTVVADGFKLRKTKAGVYVIDSVFEVNGEDKKIEGTLYFGEKKGITTTDDTAGVLIKTQTISKINAGNVFETVEITTNRNIISRIFTSFNIEPTLIERDGFNVKYTWIKERLGPSDVFTVKARTNYVLPFFILAVAILAILGMRRYNQTKLSLKKTVSPVKTKGGEFALRITLTAKAVKSVENVSVVDRVPRIVKIYKKFGSIQPDKVDAQTRRIHWNLGDMGAGEERVVSYIVYSKVGVVGKFNLPRALCVFERDQAVHEVESNNVFFMNEQVSE